VMYCEIMSEKAYQTSFIRTSRGLDVFKIASRCSNLMEISAMRL